MKRTVLVIGLIAVLAISLFALTGCGAEESKGIVGTWKYGSGTTFMYTFNADGTGSYAGRNFKYTDTGSSVTITYDGDTASGTYNYTIEGNTLKITESFGSIVEYKK